MTSRGAALVAGLALVGCASAPLPPEPTYEAAVRPSVLEPVTDDERSLLAQLPSLDAASDHTVSSGRVGVAYHAASGRLCRRVDLIGSSKHLVCELETGAWGFVPDVAAE